MGATIFAGVYAPIDIADGGGMNLMDILTKKWHKSACAIAGAGVEGLLGPSPVPAHTVVGPVRLSPLAPRPPIPASAACSVVGATALVDMALTATVASVARSCVQISPYFVGEYGFPETCKAVAWSGDNPCAVAGMRLENAGDACISLGTSDTIFALLGEPSPKTEGHIFGSPVDPAGYMALICFLNGSLVRERVREKVGAADWGAFGELLKETSAGNGGSIAIHYDDPEITPHVPKAVEAFYNGDDEAVDSLAPAEEARAVIEARFISMRVHAEFIGLKMDRIYATGGASQNKDITQVIADVFGCDVYTMSSPGGAPLGAAYRALHALKCEEAGEYVRIHDASLLSICLCARLPT
jgi:xylulokinase